MVGALADSERKVFWLDSPAAPEPLQPLEGAQRCRLAVVGGGFTGLWAALLAAEAGDDVVLLEGDRCGWGASGRNGGFLEASLTHGLENGLARWPGEIDRLLALGRENFAAIRATIERRGIDAAWEESGAIDVATRRHEVGWLEHAADACRAHGEDVLRFSTATACAPRSTRPPIWPGSGTGERAPWSIPPGSRGGFAGRRSKRAPGSSSTARFDTSTATAPL